jgi:AraC family transcriptional regulator, regulatory protein of adaptative response / methylated-DNA-[protein]-cysteine methyltransferase
MLNETAIPESQLEIVQEVCRYIDERLDQGTPTLNELSQQVNVSSFHLQRVFKQVMGITPRQYAEAQRVRCLKNHLRDGRSVTDALYEAGYGSTSRLYEGAPEKLGMTPATYRNGGEGMRIQYSITECALGLVLVGSTERGICSVLLGDDENDLVRRLHDEFPAAETSRNRQNFCNWLEAIIDHLNGSRLHLDLPLDVQATVFQWRVLNALREIPYGETRTYSEIAEAIGQPGAARAVAKVCATNPVPVAIPCHRVVRKDGQPSKAYAGGSAWRKQWLLEWEQRHSGPQGTARSSHNGAYSSQSGD